MQSLEKLVQKYYKTEEKQRRILEVIHLKLYNLSFLSEMFTSYSKLYLYDLGKREDSDFDSDYLMVHEMRDRTLHLGIIKTGKQEKDLCQCNSFMTTYKKDKNSDSFYRDLARCYEINSIVREDKMTKRGCLRNAWIKGKKPLYRIFLYYGRREKMAYKQELWDEAKKKCRIGDEEIRMAKEMGLNPKSLIKNIPNKKEMWKAPVKDWIHDMYDKRQRKSQQRAKREAAQ